ncbi:hypothetical protein HPB52_015564 [Rhipicephalus sanguineus]|uniref:Tick transposon n=1 Tax=Rhipicephalus sanguineus TaxID=34632 RepID=A0A9D4PFE3_RHISA|nr:hypothetical protein HPB52_015564 [Rhipicephalus sanguineus]
MQRRVVQDQTPRQQVGGFARRPREHSPANSERVIRRIRIPPIPKHMHPKNDHERRRARAIALTKNHRDDPHAYYVDVAKYPHMKNAYAAAVLRASTGKITSAGSIRCKTPAQAEEYAIALAMHTTGCHTILGDAKTAVINYSHDSVHFTTTRSEPATDPDSEDVNYAITQYGEVLQWYRTSHIKYPPPHRDLTRNEATTLRQLQARAIWTPVLAKHICPEIYHTDTCQRCERARATQNHVLWECLPPPPNTQNGQIPEEIDKKITSEEYETQRDTVRHVLELLDLQKPGTTDRSQDVS